MINFRKYPSLTKVVMANSIQRTDNSLYNAFYNMRNLTSANIPNTVTNMSSTYWNCQNLTGSPVCGNNVTSMSSTYRNCYNLHGNAYFYSNRVSNIYNCFYGRNSSNTLNIYVHNGSSTLSRLKYNNSYSLVGTSITWTNAGTYLYNTSYNIYIYPVDNVADARRENGD